ncbi:MAG: phage GP46 family protein [Deltaproteobacteria bacterium]|nr:phage GP46 family protein [Deltaproteobacteria bacterium]
MDFKIKTASGRPQMTFEKADNIMNNIYLSLAIAKGSFFMDPQFGHRFNEVRKNTAGAPGQVKEYAKEALQWLIKTGRAKKIEIVTERDGRERIKIRVEATQADGREVTFDTFYEVV